MAFHKSTGPNLCNWDTLYRILCPVIRRVPPELAHSLAVRLLQLPFLSAPVVYDPFQWRGIEFRNRVGIAAGFDKDAGALAGAARLGAGFIEFGTVLPESWPGNRVRPRLQ